MQVSLKGDGLRKRWHDAVLEKTSNVECTRGQIQQISFQKNKFRCPRDARLLSNVFAAETLARVLSTSVRGLEMPVNERPSCARGACPFLCPWSALCSCLLHMYNRTVL